MTNTGSSEGPMPLSILPVVTPPVRRDLYFKTCEPIDQVRRRPGDFATAEMLPHRMCFLGTRHAGFVRRSSKAFQVIRGADPTPEFGFRVAFVEEQLCKNALYRLYC